jgi:hypothetical protein
MSYDVVPFHDINKNFVEWSKPEIALLKVSSVLFFLWQTAQLILFLGNKMFTHYSLLNANFKKV